MYGLCGIARHDTRERCFILGVGRLQHTAGLLAMCTGWSVGSSRRWRKCGAV